MGAREDNNTCWRGLEGPLEGREEQEQGQDELGNKKSVRAREGGETDETRMQIEGLIIIVNRKRWRGQKWPERRECGRQD